MMMKKNIMIKIQETEQWLVESVYYNLKFQLDMINALYILIKDFNIHFDCKPVLCYLSCLSIFLLDQNSQGNDLGVSLFKRKEPWTKS